MADKECQTSIVNYKKNGDAFVNLVTIIPVPGGVAGNFDEQGDIVYQIGFELDSKLIFLRSRMPFWRN